MQDGSMQAEPTVVIGAQLIVNGAFMYLRPDETWTSRLQEAALFSWREGEQQLAARSRDRSPLVFGLNVFEAERRGESIEVFGLSCGHAEGSR
jgi:hypothetical protein